MLFSYYTPVLILQAFCLYHAHRNNSLQQWFWLIVFIPLIGCLIYLYTNFWNRRKMDSLAEGVKQVVNTNYKLETLEKAVKVTPTTANKVLLADTYLENRRFKDAISLYEACLTGLHDNDPDILAKAMRAHFLQGSYAEAGKIGEKLEAAKSLKDADNRVVFAWTLAKLGQPERATAVFKSLDGQFSNYAQRLEFGKFLLESGQQVEAKKKLKTLLDEFDHMDRYEQRLKRPVYREVKRLFDTV